MKNWLTFIITLGFVSLGLLALFYADPITQTLSHYIIESPEEPVTSTASDTMTPPSPTSTSKPFLIKVTPESTVPSISRPGSLAAQVPTANQPLSTPPPAIPASPPQPSPTEEKLTTISNETIDKIISRKLHLFRKCQANGLRDGGVITGNLLVSLTILPKGKIDQVRIVQSNMDNSQFISCVTSVFKRCKFPEFEGSPIIRNFPLNFK